MLIPALAFVENSFHKKTAIEKFGQKAFAGFSKAKDNLASGEFESASANFSESYDALSEADTGIDEIGGKFSDILRFVPGISSVATADYLVGAGKDIASAGKKMTNSLKILAGMENPLDADAGKSLTEVFLALRDAVGAANADLMNAQEKIAKANPDDLPEDLRLRLLELQQKLPAVTKSLSAFTEDSEIILDVLGYNGPRKFLFLFQNNQEMRATGGFIGSYGILDISQRAREKTFCR